MNIKIALVGYLPIWSVKYSATAVFESLDSGFGNQPKLNYSQTGKLVEGN